MCSTLVQATMDGATDRASASHPAASRVDAHRLKIHGTDADHPKDSTNTGVCDAPRPTGTPVTNLATVEPTTATSVAVGRRARPRRRLMAIDTVAILITVVTVTAWTAFTQPARDVWLTALPGLLVAASAPIILVSLKLYVRAANRIASAEMVRVARAASFLAAVVLFGHAAIGRPGAFWPAAVTGIMGFCTLSLGRQFFRDHLRVLRRRGDLSYGTLVVGTEAGVRRLTDLLRTHPEMGFEAAGFAVTADVNRDALGMELDLPCFGQFDDDGRLILDHHTPDGAIVASGALPQLELDAAVHALLDRRIHVHVLQGLTGIGAQRMFPDPLLTDNAVYIAPETINTTHLFIKRVVDLSLGTLAIMVLSPLLAAIAVAIRLSDPGPILFRQTRIGHDGEPFKVLKFRTMVVDAEARLAELQEDNVRGGPLFKMANDPRITRIGAFLRKTSLDELPQLLNVLQGEMSLVGPRPALPEEVEQFDEELLERLSVRPGITGLWQVEARDDASFDLYRRFDLFYIRNWSLLLDLVILFRTVASVLLRPYLSRSAARLGGRGVEGAAVLD